MECLSEEMVKAEQKRVFIPYHLQYKSVHRYTDGKKIKTEDHITHISCTLHSTTSGGVFLYIRNFYFGGINSRLINPGKKIRGKKK